MTHELGPLPEPILYGRSGTAKIGYTADQTRSYAAAEVARAVAAERAFWMPAIVLAQQCIAASYNDRWPEFDRLSDEFDDACADALLRLKPG